MKIFIVGGYVRDRLLGIESKDHDFVVVGSTHDQMIADGFKQVGADFPVYLHPLTGDEYALARTERKVGAGYHGFETDFNPNVTLEEDLFRRDLTINAMAREVLSFDELGHAKLSDEIIDPFNGQLDLEEGRIRHVSDAFGDDPVRVLRAARFACRYGFGIASETWDMMKWMVRDGELNHLTVERVWLEATKAMMEKDPMDFFHVLNNCGALEVVMPHLEGRLSQVRDFVTNVAEADGSIEMRFAALTSEMSPINCASFYEAMKSPSDITSFAVKFNWLLPLLKKGLLEGDKSCGEIAIDLIEKLASGGNNRDTIFDMLHDTVIHLNEKYGVDVFTLQTVHNYTKEMNFDSLSENDQSVLKGREIGEAIRTERSNIANKIIFKLF